MPRYLYACNECLITGSFFHSLNEGIEDCAECATTGSMQKMLSVPNIQKAEIPTTNSVGALTREYIELNREILKEERTKTLELDNEQT